MKRLSVLRHAKSSFDDSSLADFNRPLNERGWKSARRIGRELRNRGASFDLVLASPAARVRETIDGIEEKLEFSAPIQFDKRLYLAGEELLLNVVRDLPETVRNALLVGHNPGLQRLLLELSGEDDQGFHERVSEKFPTAAFAVVELPARAWSDMETGSGRIIDLIFPRDLD